MRRGGPQVAVIAIAAAVGLACVLATASRPSVATMAAATPASFDAASVERGARLAAVGDCSSCHTASNGRPYAGGVPLATPFGTIHGTNITPDPETGIGGWSEGAFVRAMREGIARDGSHLYPAFPYDHFTHTTDDDLHALYAYLMTRDPVRAPNRANDLRFPFNIRPLIAAWNVLYLRQTAFHPEPSRSAEWNRGAYLVQSLGHCGSCHSPRNALGAEKTDAELAGGEAQGWYAPALNDASPSPLPWTVEQLSVYLRTGIARDHAIAGGPMQEVAGNLAHASADDVHAIAVYIESTMGPLTGDREARANGAQRRAAGGPLPNVSVEDQRIGTSGGTASGNAALAQLGITVYDDACAACHDLGRTDSSSGALRLPLAVAVYDPDPRSLLRIVRDGIAPLPGQPGRWMPAFGSTLSDEQLVALLAYLRAAAAEAPPWRELPKSVREANASP
jgi:mono/diheme cytochrome c family protein